MLSQELLRLGISHPRYNSLILNDGCSMSGTLNYMWVANQKDFFSLNMIVA
jgi:hypothetical protein